MPGHMRGLIHAQRRRVRSLRSPLSPGLSLFPPILPGSSMLAASRLFSACLAMASAVRLCLLPDLSHGQHHSDSCPSGDKLANGGL